MKKKYVLLSTVVVAAAALYGESQFDEHDADKDGKLSLPEFLEFKKEQMTAKGKRYVEKAQVDAFNFYDEDRDGFVTQRELLKPWVPPSQR